MAEAAKTREYPFDKKTKRRKKKPGRNKGRKAKQKREHTNGKRNKGGGGNGRKQKPQSKESQQSHFGEYHTATSANQPATSASNTPSYSPFRNKRAMSAAALRRLLHLERTSRDSFGFLGRDFTLNCAKIQNAYQEFRFWIWWWNSEM